MSLQKEAYRFIRQRILSGDIPPGKQVSEYSLSKELGLGRTPVREAISRLQLEGYVERIPRFGTIVRQPSAKDIEDLYELRVALESYAANEAAIHAAKEDIEHLRQLCEDLQQIRREHDLSGTRFLSPEALRHFRATDMSFHIHLIRITGNTRIMQLVTESQVMTRVFCNLIPQQDSNSIVSAYYYHSEVLKAVEESNSDKARTLMIEHIRKSEAGTVENLRRSLQQQMPAGSQELGLPAELAEDLFRIEQTLRENSKTTG